MSSVASRREPPQVPAGPHQPERPAFSRSRGRRLTKWACGCGYWTGYTSDDKAREAITAHCQAKNALWVHARLGPVFGEFVGGTKVDVRVRLTRDCARGRVGDTIVMRRSALR